MRQDLWLKPKDLFQKIFSQGRTAVSGVLVLRFLFIGKNQPVKIGFVVSKKVGKAVVRNKLKRRLKELMARRAVRLKEGYFLVFIARPGAASLSFKALDAEVERLIGRAGLFRDSK